MNTTQDERPILLLAYTGIIIRNLVMGSFTDAICRNRPLVIAVQDPKDADLLGLLKGKPVTLVPFPVTKGIANDGLRRWYSWPNLVYYLKLARKAPVTIDRNFRNFDSGRSAVSRSSVRLLLGAGRVLDKANLTSAIESRYLKSRSQDPVTAKWTAMFQELNPAAVISTLLTLVPKEDVSPDLAPVLAACNLGIPCGTLVQSWDNLTSKCCVLPQKLDRYWTWSERMSVELLQEYPSLAKDRVVVVGSPQFDFHQDPLLAEAREVFMPRIGLDPKRPYVLIGTGTPKRLPTEPETVLSLIRALFKAQPNMQALIRIHPKDDGVRWKAIAAGELPGVVLQQSFPRKHMDAGGFVLPRNFYFDQINAIQHSAVVINTSSTLTVDAAILDRPVVCLAYDVVPDPVFPEGRAFVGSRTAHYSPLVATGGVPVTTSEADCVRAIERYLENPSLHQVGRKAISEMVTARVGGAGEQLAVEALALAASGQPAACCAASANH